MFEDNNLLKIQEKEISIYTAESKTLPHNDVNILSAREKKKFAKQRKQHMLRQKWVQVLETSLENIKNSAYQFFWGGGEKAHYSKYFKPKTDK